MSWITSLGSKACGFGVALAVVARGMPRTLRANSMLSKSTPTILSSVVSKYAFGADTGTVSVGALPPQAASPTLVAVISRRRGNEKRGILRLRIGHKLGHECNGILTETLSALTGWHDVEDDRQ